MSTLHRLLTTSSPLLQDQYQEARSKAAAFLRQEGYHIDTLYEVPVDRELHGQSLRKADSWSVKYESSHKLFKHVNNIQYLVLFESGRMGFLDSLISEMDEPELWKGWLSGQSSKLGVVVSGIESKYKSAVLYPDTMLIAHRASEVQDDRFVAEAVCYSLEQNRPAVTSRVKFVAFDYNTNRKTTLPSDMKAALERRVKKL